MPIEMESLEYWNLRAETFGGKGQVKPGGYIARLMELLALEDGQTVFDMGCATGTLALPLARAGHAVRARDFSPRMIERLQAAAREEGLAVDAAVMAWEDDWEACGIAAGACDVAVASRSLARGDGGVAEPLRKLDRVARVKAAVTVSASLAPAVDGRLLAHLGRKAPVPREHVEVIDALAGMGRLPTLTYIPFERPMRFDTWDMALLELRNLAGAEPFDAREEALFNQYAAEHFREERAEGGTVYQLDYRLPVSWAYIEWQTGERA